MSHRVSILKTNGQWWTWYIQEDMNLEDTLHEVLRLVKLHELDYAEELKIEFEEDADK